VFHAQNDHIIISGDSYVYFAYDSENYMTTFRSGNDETRNGNLYLYEFGNRNGQISTLRGSIHSINNIRFVRSSMLLEYLKIDDVQGLLILDDSTISMRYSTYENSTNGVLVSQSVVHFDNVVVQNNDHIGVRILASPGTNTIKHSSITGNGNGNDKESGGLQICFSGVEILYSSISSNVGPGIRVFGNNRPVIRGLSTIENNSLEEVSSLTRYGFPFFSGMTDFRRFLPIVSSYPYDEETNDKYLFMVDTIFLDPIYIGSVIVVGDSYRFSPHQNLFKSLNLFVIPNEANDFLIPPEVNQFFEAILATEACDIPLAKEKLMDIITDYPHTFMAKSAVSHLPYLNFDYAGTTARSEMLSFLTAVNHSSLSYMVADAIATTMLHDREYETAISLFRHIRQYPPGLVEALLAEIMELYCVLRLEEEGSRDKATGISSNEFCFERFYSAKAAILYGLDDPDAEKDDQIPELFVFSTNNFPNPFNPNTTIRFTLPSSEDGKMTSVELVVYNIRGQRVKTLLSGSTEFGSGHHSVLWDGTDDHGRSMGSGVYFYRINAGENNAVRRMLLLK
jgi:hypothetical protein